MSEYTATVPPDAQVDPRIVPFYESFYAISDTPGPEADEKYADQLTPDGTLIMAGKTATGREAILACRQGLWAGPVNKRKHHLHKIHPFGTDSHDIMLHGSVDYGLKNGTAVSVDWAAHAQLAEVEGELKMKFYQVYVDSGPVARAAAD